MRAITAILVLSLFAFASLLAQEPPTEAAKPAKPLQKASSALRPFVGTWRLVSSEETLPNGTVRPYGFGPRPAGILMYDARGNMCAQVVNTDRPTWKNPDKPTAEEIKTAFDGFGGYCGTYTVDEKQGTMAHRPEVAFDPNLSGQSKPRNYRFEGSRLIYSGTDETDDGQVKWVMVWEKVK